MSKELNYDTQRQAREFARKITVAHDLDPEIQEELYGHIEDKLLAYKSGEERISDEDAFILVREHFGDAKVLRALMREVHARAVHHGLVRSLLAVTIIMLAAKAMMSGLGAIVTLVVWFGSDEIRRMEHMVVNATLLSWLHLAVVFLALAWWRRDGVSPWFLRWPLWQMIVVILAFLLFSWAMPRVGGVARPWNFNEPMLLTAAAFTERWIIPFALCAIWVWWNGAISSAWKHAMVICVLWAIFRIVMALSPADLFLAIGAGQKSMEAAHRLAVSWTMFGSDMTLYALNRWDELGPGSVLYMAGREFLRAASCYVALSGVAHLLRRGRVEIHGKVPNIAAR